MGEQGLAHGDTETAEEEEAVTRTDISTVHGEYEWQHGRMAECRTREVQRSIVLVA